MPGSETPPRAAKAGEGAPGDAKAPTECTDPGSEEACVVDILGLKKYFDIKMGLAGIWAKAPAQVKAVDDVTFHIGKAEIVGLVGETGCGKTTVGRLILRLDDPTEGVVKFEGVDIAGLKPRAVKKFRKRAQMIFQDPYASLNPRMTVSQSVSEPLLNYGEGKDPEKVAVKVAKALADAGLRPVEQYIERFPHELSGGERQRVSVARALVMDPKFIVADEPVSMLDVSIRAGVMNLMLELRDKYDIAYLLITHDISVSRYMCDRMAIMYLGKIMEIADSETIVKAPKHPYTQALLKAVPVADPTREREELPIKGEIPSAINRPSGCVFRTRCPFVRRQCHEELAFTLGSEFRGALDGRAIDERLWRAFEQAGHPLGGGARAEPRPSDPVMKVSPIVGGLDAKDLSQERLLAILRQNGIPSSGNALVSRAGDALWEMTDEPARYLVRLDGDWLTVHKLAYWDIQDVGGRYRLEEGPDGVRVFREAIPGLAPVGHGHQVACIRVERGEI